MVRNLCPTLIFIIFFKSQYLTSKRFQITKNIINTNFITIISGICEQYFFWISFFIQSCKSRLMFIMNLKKWILYLHFLQWIRYNLELFTITCHIKITSDDNFWIILHYFFQKLNDLLYLYKSIIIVSTAIIFFP